MKERDPEEASLFRKVSEYHVVSQGLGCRNAGPQDSVPVTRPHLESVIMKALSLLLDFIPVRVEGGFSLYNKVHLFDP